MKSNIALGVTILGGLLLVLSFAWGFIFSAEQAWTPEKSDMVRQLSSEVQSLHMKVKLGERNPEAYGGRDPVELNQEYEQAKAKLATLKAEFEQVTQAPRSTASLLRWTGLVGLIIGLVALRTLDGK